MFGNFPGGQHIFNLGICRLHFGDNIQILFCDLPVITALHQIPAQH